MNRSIELDNSRFESIPRFLLFIIILISTIHWLPSLHPQTIRYMGVVFIILFAISINTWLVIRGRFPIFQSYVAMIPILLIPIYIVTFGPETAILYYLFFISSLSYFYICPSKRIFHEILLIFSTSVVAQSSYAILTTFSPLPHIPTTYVRVIGEVPVSLYGFSGGKLYILLSISLIISIYLSNIYSKKIFFVYSLILFTHLIVFVLMTGTGRTGLLLLFSILLFRILYWLELKKLIPLLMASPAVSWVTLYIIYFMSPEIIYSGLFESVDNFVSGRLLLYIGSIDIVVRDLLIVDRGGYTLSQIFPLPYSASIPQTTHNLLFNILLDKGILIGGLIGLWLWKIGQISSGLPIKQDNKDVILASTIVTAYIFVGLSIGGAVLFNLTKSIIWWLFLAYLLTSVSRRSVQIS